LRAREELHAEGHPNILATHSTTFEITRHQQLSKRGDCIIGVRADKGPRDFNREFKDLCQRDNARIRVELFAGGITETIEGMGSPNLILTHPSESVGRKSSHMSNRTIMVQADRAAVDLSRDLVALLTSPRTRLRVVLTVEV
jgi:hypothetical protein